MLELALQSKLPLIRVTTADTINVEAVLSHLIGGVTPVVGFQQYTWPFLPGSKYVWNLGDIGSGHAYEEVYRVCAENGHVCVIVNGEENPLLFDAGRVPVPREMIKDILMQVVTPPIRCSLGSGFSHNSWVCLSLRYTPVAYRSISR